MDARLAIALIGGATAILVLVYFVWAIRRARKRGQWHPPEFLTR